MIKWRKTKEKVSETVENVEVVETVQEETSEKIIEEVSEETVEEVSEETVEETIEETTESDSLYDDLLSDTGTEQIMSDINQKKANESKIDKKAAKKKKKSRYKTLTKNLLGFHILKLIKTSQLKKLFEK